MDDIVLFGNSKRELLELKPRIEKFLLDRLGLCLKSNVTCLNRSSHGLSFLGMRIFPALIRMKPENRRRSLKRLKDVFREWQNGELDEDSMTRSMASIVGHFRYFCPTVSVTLEAGAAKAAPTGWTGAAAGTTTRGTVVQLIVTGTIPATGTTTWAFASWAREYSSIRFSLRRTERVYTPVQARLPASCLCVGSKRRDRSGINRWIKDWPFCI